MAHGSEIGIPGVGAFSTTTNAAFRVDHRDLVGSATQVKNNPESATGQLRQGGTNITPAGGFSHGTNAGVKASRRGLVPLNVAHGSKMEDLARKAPREDPTSMVSGGYVQSESSPSDETFPENEGKD